MLSNHTRLAQHALEMGGASITSRQHATLSDLTMNGGRELKMNGESASRTVSTAPALRSPYRSDQLSLVQEAASDPSLAPRVSALYDPQQRMHQELAASSQPPQRHQNGQNGNDLPSAASGSLSISPLEYSLLQAPPIAASNTFAYGSEELLDNAGLEFFDSFIDFEADKEAATI